MILGIVGRSADPTGAMCSLGTGKDTVANCYVERAGFQKVGLADPLKRFCREVYGFTHAQLWGPSMLRAAPDPRYPRPEHSWELYGKELECACCGYRRPYTGTHEDALCALTPRFVLQQLGTQWGRHMWEDTWMRVGLSAASALLADPRHSMYDPACGVVPRIEMCPNGEFERDDAPKGDIKGVVFSDIRFQNELKRVKAEGGKLLLVYREVDKVSATAKDMSHQSENDLNGLGLDDPIWDGVIHNNGDVTSLEERALVVLRGLAE